MLTFLFWNTNGKPLVEAIVELVEEQSIDVLMLAECDVAPARLLMALNRNESLFYFAPGQSPRLVMFTRFPDRYVAPAFDSDRISIRRLALPAREEILLALVHLPSKLYWSDDSQMLECTELARTIGDEERHAGHSRTIVVGDRNMNPFEKGLVGASGLPATMARTVAERASRVIQGKPYSFFYNPMWGHLGDWLERPPGSFYYERAEQVTYF